MNSVTITHNGHSYCADMSRAIDLSIAITFDSPQLKAFGAPSARASVFSVDSFIGNVKQGGSCNCSTYSLTPHCNGTHTECVSHITREFMSVNSVAPVSLLLATVVSVTPEKTVTSFSRHDAVITREQLQKQLAGYQLGNAVIVRSLPNDNKLHADYDSHMPCYFSEDALAWLANINIDHLLVDLPSVDRMHDNGLLLAHRAFWGMPHGSTALSQAKRSHATITELIFVADDVPDGNYLLNLQVASFETDAAPSRPVLYPLVSSSNAS